MTELAAMGLQRLNTVMCIPRSESENELESSAPSHFTSTFVSPKKKVVAQNDLSSAYIADCTEMETGTKIKHV